MTQKEKLNEAKRLYKTANSDQRYVLESLFPELRESGDERVRKVLIDYFNLYKEQEECGINTFYGIPTDDILAWLEKQGSITKLSKWAEGDVVRHGGVLALVTNGRKAMKSNCEQITIQYPDEWVKAETKERKYFFEELGKQGEQKPTDEEMKEALRTEYEKGRADAFAEMQKEWSEEDENMLKMAIKSCEQCGNEYAYYWLKSLKQRIGG